MKLFFLSTDELNGADLLVWAPDVGSAVSDWVVHWEGFEDFDYAPTYVRVTTIPTDGPRRRAPLDWNKMETVELELKIEPM